MSGHSLPLPLAAVIDLHAVKVERLGYLPRQLGMKWRTEPPPFPVDAKDFPAWMQEAEVAVADVLKHEGGDAIFMLSLILTALAKQAAAARGAGEWNLRELRRVEAEIAGRDARQEPLPL